MTAVLLVLAAALAVLHAVAAPVADQAERLADDLVALIGEDSNP